MFAWMRRTLADTLMSSVSLNEHKTDDAGRFALALPGVVGKRLMYKELIGAMPLGQA